MDPANYMCVMPKMPKQQTNSVKLWRLPYQHKSSNNEENQSQAVLDRETGMESFKQDGLRKSISRIFGQTLINALERGAM
ncbi:hypothetical protein T265_07186 [Opisthorchis viverrini]|uniref:Uncharacterized protein n=1 Tax=Opisthorchis viverrini TaxID=6198 RepID=A0A074ZDD2_OPIVI|nr:hypothetical protein T265_07186 [Opisthorchis viverrini]KER25306.1 hypothetical protein T265_07186 [Opisthorchis viverrini]